MLQLLPGNKVLCKQETKVLIIGVMIIIVLLCAFISCLVNEIERYCLLPIPLLSLVLSIYLTLLPVNVCALSVSVSVVSIMTLQKC